MNSIAHRSAAALASSVLAVVLQLAVTAPHAEEQSVARELAEMSLEELTKIEFSTASRRSQHANEIAAAVFVITQDDIRRSGARSIPEALRLAPGLEVAQIDSNVWAISARGFNGRFANKLLVLMDGRTLYTPSFSGTYWDQQDTVMENIDRIEVIRGPAGTIWGTNAVNGIINIITKRAFQTEGVAVSGSMDHRGDASVHARVGSADAERAWRLYAKAARRENNVLTDGRQAYDGTDQARIGARADMELDEANALAFSSEAYKGTLGQTITGSVLTAGTGNSLAIPDEVTFDGAWGLLGWTHEFADESRLELQTYAEHANGRESLFAERRDSFDVHLQHNIARIGAHTWTWGAGARLTRDYFYGTRGFTIVPAKTSSWLWSGYAQDEIALFDERAHLTSGLRVEHSRYGGTAVLPNVRALFALTERSSIWAAVARGERRPGRAEIDIHLVGPAVPANSAMNPLPRPVRYNIEGDDDFRSERLMAYELGWRWQPNDHWSFDVSTYYDDYSRLRGGPTPVVYCEPAHVALASNPACIRFASELVAQTSILNPNEGSIYGGELLLRWAPISQWRLTAAYSLMKKDVAAEGTGAALMFLIGEDPEHQYSLRSTLAIGPLWDWDITARYVDRLAPFDIAGYAELGTRLAWRPTLDWEVALTGNNLLHGSHLEAYSELSDMTPTAIERSIGLQLRWSFH